jgi:hypothetical protein
MPEPRPRAAPVYRDVRVYYAPEDAAIGGSLRPRWGDGVSGEGAWRAARKLSSRMRQSASEICESS